MSRNYGSLGRRSGNTVWQWVVIGAIVGFGCSVILVLGALAFGILSLSGQPVANLATQTPFIITATPAPVTPTTTELPVIATEEALVVEPPTATPTVDPTVLTAAAPTLTPTPPMVGFGTTPEVSSEGGADPLSLSAGSGSNVDPRFSSVVSMQSDLVSIDGGTFEMGTSNAEIAAAVQECVQGYGGEAGTCIVDYGADSIPAHQVTISPFFIEETEVSYAQFLAFLNAMGPGSHVNGCFNMPCAQTTNDSENSNILYDSQNYSVNVAINNFPAANVTWFGAQAYCQAIGRRLPTEAEWERAARGPNNYIYPWGDDWNGANAATSRNENGEQSQTQAVDSYTTGAALWPTGSVLNMAGNAAEWVSDWYDPNYYDSVAAAGPDPQGPANGTERVNRGGSWATAPFFARAVHRRSAVPNTGLADLGFRCASDTQNGASTTSEAPIGSEPLPVNTVDPASLGVNGGASDEETTSNSQPTLQPQPTQPPAATATQAPVGTLDPNN